MTQCNGSDGLVLFTITAGTMGGAILDRNGDTLVAVGGRASQGEVVRALAAALPDAWFQWATEASAAALPGEEQR